MQCHPVVRLGTRKCSPSPSGKHKFISKCNKTRYTVYLGIFQDRYGREIWIPPIAPEKSVTARFMSYISIFNTFYNYWLSLQLTSIAPQCSLRAVFSLVAVNCMFIC